ncbi:MAG: IS1595 family transposase [Acidobacteriaceae bacterium]|nr:IS1595 family transposase [Acidobacteriaceae bacterium]
MEAAAPKTLQDAIVYFSSPDNCLNYLVARRWPNGVRCPICGNTEVHFLKNQRRWECKGAKHPKKQFSVKVGTIFEDSAIGLDKWLTAVWMVVSMKNGVSSWEIHRSLGVTQKTAWFMLQRIRLGLQDPKARKLSGQVEVDESYIGAKARNMHRDRKEKLMQGKGGGVVGKVGVQGMLERGGEIRLRVIRDSQTGSLVPNIQENVESGSHLFTDEARAYFGLQANYVHDFINHAEAYAIGNIHTNGLENFWSLMKRQLSGTYVSVEPFHLFRYLDEQAFRYNNRKGMTDADRFDKALTQIVGKRLTYKELTGKTGTEAEETRF